MDLNLLYLYYIIHEKFLFLVIKCLKLDWNIFSEPAEN